MKKTRPNKNDPDYIDIFAEDEDTGDTSFADSLFDDEEESVLAVSKKEKRSGGLFSRKQKPVKHPSKEADDFDDEDAEEEAEPPRPAKKSGLFSRRSKEDPEDVSGEEEDLGEDEDFEEIEPSRSSKKRGLFSRRSKKEPDKTYEDEEDESEDDDEPEENDEEAESGNGLHITWSERDEDEEPASPDIKEPSSDRVEKKKRFSLRHLFSDGSDEDDLSEDELYEDELFDAGLPEEESSRKKKHTDKHSSEDTGSYITVPAENKDEDWDIGGDFSDVFTEPGSESPQKAEPSHEPDETAESSEEDFSDAKEPKEEDTFSFDRYGRRKNRAKRSLYGRRKNARQATTTVVTNETDTSREEEAARIRAQKRDIIRDREIEKRRQERRTHFLRELKQRLTVAGLLGILLVLVLLAAFFAFRITGIDVTGVCTRYSAETIVEKSGLVRGRHILLQDLSGARESLNADPYLSASVKYVFPNKINITISERSGVGAVQWGPNSEFLALIDINGYVLEANLASEGGLPVVKGLIVTRVVAGTKIGDDADEQVQSTLDVLRALNEFGLLYSVTSVDISETMGISLYTPEGYRIEIGNVSDLNTKLNRLKKGWKTIMNTAAEQMKKPSVDNVTIYLYSKSGVVVSPHGIGFVDESQLEIGKAVLATPEPVNPFAEDPYGGYTGEPYPGYYVPEATPEPVDIIPNFNNDPFTG